QLAYFSFPGRTLIALVAGPDGSLGVLHGTLQCVGPGAELDVFDDPLAGKLGARIYGIQGPHAALALTADTVYVANSGCTNGDGFVSVYARDGSPRATLRNVGSPSGILAIPRALTPRQLAGSQGRPSVRGERRRGMPGPFRSFPALAASVLASVLLTAQAPAPPPTSTSDVLQATLKNGLHVVIVRNALAPAVATDMTYLVGSRDDAPHFPGMAHAQEHMMFRGTSALSTAQLGTIATALGGTFNAQTDDTLTQFQFTVPAADLDAVLRIESDRMRGALDLQSQWESER